MTQLINYADFRERLEARTDRWSLLREVLDEWGVKSEREPEPEFSPEAIRQAEGRLGVIMIAVR